MPQRYRTGDWRRPARGAFKNPLEAACPQAVGVSPRSQTLFGNDVVPGNSVAPVTKRSFEDKCVPKQSLGTRREHEQEQEQEQEREGGGQHVRFTVSCRMLK